MIAIQNKQTRTTRKPIKNKQGYCKATVKINKNSISKNSNRQYDDEIDETDEVKTMVNKTKNKVKLLNPVRRARQNFTGEDGSNNPNVAGQDNGANAWLDLQLNGDELDSEARYNTTYAKRNSDKNRFFDIDDIPIKGPSGTHDDDIESVISISDATNTANALLYDKAMYICRNTGMMRRKEETRNTIRQRGSKDRQREERPRSNDNERRE